MWRMVSAGSRSNSRRATSTCPRSPFSARHRAYADIGWVRRVDLTEGAQDLEPAQQVGGGKGGDERSPSCVLGSSHGGFLKRKRDGAAQEKAAPPGARSAKSCSANRRGRCRRRRGRRSP